MASAELSPFLSQEGAALKPLGSNGSTGFPPHSKIAIPAVWKHYTESGLPLSTHESVSLSSLDSRAMVLNVPNAAILSYSSLYCGDHQS